VITIEKVDKGYIVKNGVYECVFSTKKGGTMRRLKFSGIDTGLKREGCEYWTDSAHYEQEYGALSSFDVIESRDDYLHIRVCGTACSPQPIKHRTRGTCKTEYFFGDGNRIRTTSTIENMGNALRCDKYVCFHSDYYGGYSDSITGELREIGKPDDKGKEWSARHNWEQIVLFRKKNLFTVTCGAGPGSLGLFHTKHMIEVKPRWGIENQPMQLIYEPAYAE
jgi:hypothetical protein